MKLSNPKHQLAHKVHLTAVIQAGKKLRAVLIYDIDAEPTGIQVIPFCLRSVQCSHCKWLLRYYSHVNLGTLHPLSAVSHYASESPLEVDAVPSEHRSAS